MRGAAGSGRGGGRCAGVGGGGHTWQRCGGGGRPPGEGPVPRDRPEPLRNGRRQPPEGGGRAPAGRAAAGPPGSPRLPDSTVPPPPPHGSRGPGPAFKRGPEQLGAHRASLGRVACGGAWPPVPPRPCGTSRAPAGSCCCCVRGAWCCLWRRRALGHRASGWDG